MEYSEKRVLFSELWIVPLEGLWEKIKLKDYIKRL
jgi:hypothetical protein